MPNDAEPIRLQLVKADGREVVCDQAGRPLDDVRYVSYSDGFGEPGELTVTVVVGLPRWDPGLGREPTYDGGSLAGPGVKSTSERPHR